MDGLSFIANLHATTLDSRPSEPLTLRPVRRHTRSSSISSKAKDLVHRSESLFSSSSSSTSAPRTSVSSWTSRSEQEYTAARMHEQSSSTSQSDRESNLIRTKLHIDEPQISPGRCASVDLAQKSPEAVYRSVPEQSGEGEGKQSGNAPQLDPSWISTLIKNGYVFPPRSSSHCDMDWSSDMDVSPSRASSILVHDLGDSVDGRKPPLTLSLDRACSQPQLTPSLDGDRSRTRRCDRQEPIRPQPASNSTQLTHT